MERFVGAKVRLRNRVTGTTLVACSDRKSVIHINSNPEGSVWLIKGTTSNESVQLESVYGTPLSYKPGKTGSKMPRMVQGDRFETGIELVVEDVRHSGFRTVVIRSTTFVLKVFYLLLCPATHGLGVEALPCDLYQSRDAEVHISHWDLEVLETSVAFLDAQTFIGKKVRLRNSMLGTTLVASYDKKSVVHANIDGYKVKPTGSVWLIKRVNRGDKSELLFESEYGTVLAWTSEGQAQGGLVLQRDKDIFDKKDRWGIWDHLGTRFATVLIITCYCHADYGRDVTLRPVTGSSGSSQVELRSYSHDRYCYWDLEVVETPTITPQAVASSSSLVNQLYVNLIYANKKQDGKPDTSFIFPNYNVNSGRNVNESGTQNNGDVNIQTQIVKHDGY